MDRVQRMMPRLTTGILSLWPGLPGLWRQGSYSGLAQALVFAVLLQLAILTSLIWPETIRPVSRAVVWFCVLGFWIVFAVPVLLRGIRSPTGWWEGQTSVEHGEHLFQTAQREYLLGNWSAVEAGLTELLRMNPHDADATLLLATMYRRIDRLSDAAGELDQMASLESAAKWRFEMFRERHLLARQRREKKRQQDKATSQVEAA